MLRNYLGAVLFVLLLFVAILAGLFFGQGLHTGQAGFATETDTDIHYFLHEQLGVTDAQNAQLEVVEKDYSARRQLLEQNISAANRELADTIKGTRVFSPEVQQVIDRIHLEMGELQTLTVQHLFAMRAVLTNEQDQKLQQLITDALYENSSEDH